MEFFFFCSLCACFVPNEKTTPRFFKVSFWFLKCKSLQTWNGPLQVQTSSLWRSWSTKNLVVQVDAMTGTPSQSVSGSSNDWLEAPGGTVQTVEKREGFWIERNEGRCRCIRVWMNVPLGFNVGGFFCLFVGEFLLIVPWLITIKAPFEWHDVFHVFQTWCESQISCKGVNREADLCRVLFWESRCEIE